MAFAAVPGCPPSNDDCGSSWPEPARTALAEPADLSICGWVLWAVIGIGAWLRRRRG